MRELKAAVVGTGGAGRLHAAAYANGVGTKLVGVVSGDRGAGGRIGGGVWGAGVCVGGRDAPRGTAGCGVGGHAGVGP